MSCEEVNIEAMISSQSNNNIFPLPCSVDGVPGKPALIVCSLCSIISHSFHGAINAFYCYWSPRIKDLASSLIQRMRTEQERERGRPDTVWMFFQGRLEGPVPGGPPQPGVALKTSGEGITMSSSSFFLACLNPLAELLTDRDLLFPNVSLTQR